MSNMTVEYLARLGRERAILPLFERAWQSGRGSNPVATAIKIVENKRRNRNGSLLSFVMVGLFVSLGIAVWAIVTDKGDVGSTVAHMAQVVFLLLALLLAFFGLYEGKERGVNATAEANIDYFCEHLMLVSEWAGYGSFTSYSYDNEDEIKRHGTGILVKAAIEVLRLQRKEKEADSEEVREQYQEMAGREMAGFSKRYDTLKRIGLASGGYDKYFETAKERLETE